MNRLGRAGVARVCCGSHPASYTSQDKEWMEKGGRSGVRGRDVEMFMNRIASCSGERRDNWFLYAHGLPVSLQLII